MAGISTHVLDIGEGAPAPNLQVTLYRLEAGDWHESHQASTDEDGRVLDMLGGASLRSGVYRLVFNTAAHGNTFYPEVSVVFRVGDSDQHHHIPLLLGPYGYTTYRGS